MSYYRSVIALCFYLAGITVCSGQSEGNTYKEALKTCDVYKDGTYISCVDSVVNSNPSHKCKLAALLKKGVYYVGRSMPDSVIAVGKRGLSISKETEQKEKAEFYNLIAIGEVAKSDFDAAITGYMNCLKYSEETADSISIAVVKTNIANIYLKMRDNKNAQQLVEEACRIFEKEQDSANMAMSLGMLAFVNLRLLDSTSAIRNAEKAYQISTVIKNVMWEVRALGVLASIYRGKKQYDSAEYFYNKTLQIAKRESINYHVRMANVGLLNVYSLQGKYSKAMQVGEWLRPIMESKSSLSEQQKFYKVYSSVLHFSNKNDSAYKYLYKSYVLYDSIAGVKNKKIVNDIRIKYETEKKDKEIAEKQLALQQQSAKLYNRTLVAILLGLLVSVLGLVIVLIRTRNKYVLRKVEEEKRMELLKAQMAGEEKERKRIAKELHDGIANELAVIKLNAEQLGHSAAKPEDAIELNRLANIALGAHQEARRISHNLYPVPILSKGLAAAIKDYFEELPVGNMELNVQVIERHGILLKPEQQLLTFRLSQELVGNALKHSNAKEVQVDLLVSREVISITVEDDGVGISKDHYDKPECLSSIKENVRMLGGQIEIDSFEGRGTTIMISIPNVS